MWRTGRSGSVGLKMIKLKQFLLATTEKRKQNTDVLGEYEGLTSKMPVFCFLYRRCTALSKTVSLETPT